MDVKGENSTSMGIHDQILATNLDSSRGIVQVRKVWFYFEFYSTSNWSKKFSFQSQNATLQSLHSSPVDVSLSRTSQVLSCCEQLSQVTAELKATLLILFLYLFKMRRLRPQKKLFLLRYFLSKTSDSTSFADSNLNKKTAQTPSACFYGSATIGRRNTTSESSAGAWGKD